MEKDIGEEIISKLKELDKNIDKLIKDKNEKEFSTSSNTRN